HGLQRFVEAQHEISREHEAGEIDHRIDASEFSGAYKEMANGINMLVSSHIAVQARVVEVVASYGNGDLSVNMERMPGKQARITAAVDAVKSSTEAVTAEIKMLVDAAVAGDFSPRGDAIRFAFVYREMIASLNELMASADRGLNEVGSLLAAVAEGDLARRADTNL